MKCSHKPGSQPAGASCIVWNTSDREPRMITGFNMSFKSQSRTRLKNNKSLYTGTRLDFRKLFLDSSIVPVKRHVFIPTARSDFRWIYRGHYFHSWKFRKFTDSELVNRKLFQKQLKKHVWNSWQDCRKELRKSQKAYQVCLFVLLFIY